MVQMGRIGIRLFLSLFRTTGHPNPTQPTLRRTFPLRYSSFWQRSNACSNLRIPSFGPQIIPIFRSSLEFTRNILFVQWDSADCFAHCLLYFTRDQRFGARNDPKLFHTQ